MFSVTDICNIAIQIERNGERVYRQALEIVTIPKAVRILSQLAEDEKRHAGWFEELKFSMPKHSDFTHLESIGRELLQSIMKDQTFSLNVNRLGRAERLEEIIAQSIVFEKDTILFYEMLLGFIDDAGVLEQLDGIIEEERSHVKHLDMLMK